MGGPTADIAGAQRALGRRQFLARAGVLGAVVAAGGWSLPRARAQSLEDAVDALAPVLRELAHDTISGIVAFVVPGPDAYSVAQGVQTAEAGGIDARGAEFLMHALDSFLPLPDEALRPLAAALATGVVDVAGSTPLDPLLDLALEVTGEIDAALSDLLHNDATAPLSLVIALLLNGVATLVDPAAVAGPFPSSPFANLPFDGKAEVFRMLEEDSVAVAASIDAALPEPLRQSLSGLIAFVAGALLEFAAFGSYGEWGAFDHDARELTGVPVGWALSGYLAETGFRPVEGWDELLGYYQDRREVEG